MGDSGLTAYLGVVALAVIFVTLILAGVAWRIRRRTVRVGIGLGLIMLGFLCAVLSFVALVLVAGLGAAIVILGIRTMPGQSTAEGTGQ